MIGLASFAVLLAETAANFVAPGASTRAPASIVDACAVVVVTCYLGVRRATSHLLARTEKTATPIPPEVSAALRGGADAPAMPTRNIVGADGRKYCVRCLLWRPAGVRSHHCRVCNRCSVGFDHHCHILGRCIAGNCGRKGNLLAFRGLLASTGIGLFATMITLAVSAMTLFQSLVRDKGDDDGAANATSLALIDAPFEVRAAVGGGGLAVIVALVCFGCWLVQRFCEGAKQLSAAAGEEVATAEIAPAHV